MGRVAIVTDSTADLPTETRTSHQITVVPLGVVFGDQSFDEGVDLTPAQFLARLRSAFDLPTTTQPSVDRFATVFRSLALTHDEVVSIHISGRLSGTLAAAEQAAASVRESIRVHVVDSKTSSLALGFQALAASEMADQGASGETIAARLRAETDMYEAVFFPETLEYLHRGGRLGKAQALLGSVLSLKPILRIEEGAVVPHERTRTRTRAVNGLVEFVQSIEPLSRIGVMHSGDLEEAEAIAAKLQPLTPDSRVTIAELGAVLLTHLGPGAMGVAIRAGR